MKVKYTNPFTDSGFGKIFGQETGKPVSLDFLNALLPRQNTIVGLSCNNTEQLGQITGTEPPVRKFAFQP